MYFLLGGRVFNRIIVLNCAKNNSRSNIVVSVEHVTSDIPKAFNNKAPLHLWMVKLFALAHAENKVLNCRYIYVFLLDSIESIKEMSRCNKQMFYFPQPFSLWMIIFFYSQGRDNFAVTY